MTTKFALFWFMGWLTTSLISTFRVVRNKQASPSPYMDILAYTLMWPVYITIFLVTWIKYRLRGEHI
jgi:uncharacterized membrane protein